MYVRTYAYQITFNVKIKCSLTTKMRPKIAIQQQAKNHTILSNSWIHDEIVGQCGWVQDEYSDITGVNDATIYVLWLKQ